MNRYSAVLLREGEHRQALWGTDPSAQRSGGYFCNPTYRYFRLRSLAWENRTFPVLAVLFHLPKDCWPLDRNFRLMADGLSSAYIHSQFTSQLVI